MPIPVGSGTLAGGGVCSPWISGSDLAGRPDLSDAAVTAAIRDRAAVNASNLLYALSGRQFPGVCEATIRPFEPGWGCRHISNLPRMVGMGLTLDSWMASTNGGSCCPGGILLGVYPVRDILSIKIDGTVLNPTEYRVDDRRWLVRPGKIFWPAWQRLDLDDNQPATFSVTCTHGADPPADGIEAAVALAAELAKSIAGLPNRLPQRATRVSRQQVTIDLRDVNAFVKEGLVGIFEVDVFIRAYNPAKQTRRPMVYSPDMTQHRRR